jgi:hypothetical protein
MKPKMNNIQPQWKVSRWQGAMHKDSVDIEQGRHKVWMEWQARYAYRIVETEHGLQKQAYEADSMRYEVDPYSQKFRGYNTDEL